MNNLIGYQRYLVMDIIITIIIVLITIPIWMTFDMTSYASEAKSYDNYSYIDYEFLNDKVEYNLKPTSDKDGLLNIKTQNLVVYNTSNTPDDYQLILKINKFQNIDNLKINVNNIIDNITSYNHYEKGNYKYFILDEKKITGETKKYVISLWNSENATYNEENLDYELLIDNNQTI